MRYGTEEKLSDIADETRPTCCAECEIYFPDPDRPRTGWCDEFAGVRLSDDWVCHPNIGRKKNANRDISRHGEEAVAEPRVRD